MSKPSCVYKRSGGRQISISAMSPFLLLSTTKVSNAHTHTHTHTNNTEYQFQYKLPCAPNVNVTAPSGISVQLCRKAMEAGRVATPLRDRPPERIALEVTHAWDALQKNAERLLL